MRFSYQNGKRKEVVIMNYVFLDIETTGFDYKKDELILIECKKYSRDFQKLDELKLYIKPKKEITKSTSQITKITNQMLYKGTDIKTALQKLKSFLVNCYVICFNGEFDLSFLLTSMYHTEIDMQFWYLELKDFLKDQLHYKNTKQLFELYNVRNASGVNKKIAIVKKYMEDNHISDLSEIVNNHPSKWTCFFRGINYSEYLGDVEKYTFYIADLSGNKYPSYLACLKEIRKENFTLQELKELKNNYNIKILVHILDIDEEIIKITHDYYIVTYYDKEISPNEKWGRWYIEQLASATTFIATHNETVEITCYDSLEELEKKFKLIDKEIMNIIKSKIVREKKKWSRWD